ncbi:MAG: hypothetical protein JKY25_12835 [Robiginitomaculum sp.]|nr:hypothetical protein [Robiginitomaculum sp.]
MKLLRISSLLFIVSISLLVSSFARANETEAKLALQAAVTDAKSRLENNPDIRFAFKGASRESVGTKDKKIDLTDEDIRSDLIFSYDPALPESQQYHLHHPTEAENSDDRKEALYARETEMLNRRKTGEDKGDDQLLIFTVNNAGGSSGKVNKENTSNLSDKYKYLKETDTDWVFSVPFSTKGMGLAGLGDINISTSASDKKPSDKEHKMMKKVQARMPKFIKSVKLELMIDKTHKRFSGTRAYFTESLKITTGVKLQKMEIITDLVPVWEDGPLVTGRITQKMQVKLLLIKIGTTDTTVYSDFEPRKLDKEN